MSRTRRTFLQQATAFGLAWSTRNSIAQQMSGMKMPQQGTGETTQRRSPKILPPMLNAMQLTPFVDPLPLPAIAQPNSSGKLRIAMREVHASIHRDVPPTRLWTYTDLNAAQPSTTGIAPLIEARSGHPLTVEWLNQLPHRHFLPVDFSLHGCGHDIPEVRACVHLHGGRTPPAPPTATPTPGSFPATPTPATTRSSRTQPCSGTTTTPWA